MQTLIVRKITKSFFEAIAMPFVKAKVSPNLLSLIGLLAVVGVVFFLQSGQYYLAVAFVFLNGFFDAIDGSVARLRGISSAIGELLDRTIDKVSDVAIIGSIIVLDLVDLRLGLFTLCAILISTLISANIEAVLKRQVSSAFSLRFLRFIVMVAFMAAGEFTYMFIVLAVIATYSIIFRLINAIR